MMKEITDIHCHLIYGIDDGSRDINESVEIIKKYQENNFKNIIITPHYIEDSKYCANNKIKENLLENIKKKLKEENVNVNLYCGNEIFINNDIIGLLKKGEVFSLNNSKYLLIEFPFSNNILNANDILYELKVKGYQPIIAHPERYLFFQNNYKLVDEMYEEGMLFQCNYSSIIGSYGNKAKKLMKYMLKHKYVSYLGTDSHRVGKLDALENFEKIIKKILKITKEQYFNEILENCDKLVRE